ncbi:MAG: hypothetical protein NT087_03260 [Deltaproteobacteria bacterium]|nr:hypothetical protein [Deltaproteobacteria bacterium]
MASSTSNLDLLVQSQAGKEITANALFDAASPATLLGRRQSTTSGLTWGYYGGTLPIAGTPTAVANGTLSLVASRTQQIEAGLVSTTTTAITGLTLANPCVVTVASHPYGVGDVLWIDGLVGTVELNKSFALVTAVTATTITLSLSSVGLTARTSGGTLARVTSGGAVALQIGKGLGPAFVAPISLYQVVTAATTISSYTDYRVNPAGSDSQVSLSIAGAANIVLSTPVRQTERIEFTGAITANIAVIVPPVVGHAQVINNTTGAFTVTVKTPAGTGVTIPVGVPVDLSCDGTNILSSVDALLKDTSGGVVGLTLFKINFKNALNTFTSFFTNANTAARTYTFQDRDGTVADNTDLAGKAALAGASGQDFAVNSLAATATVKTGGYTVATLPAGTAGMRAYVTDATTPAYLAAVVGGGAVVTPVFYNGTGWVCG